MTVFKKTPRPENISAMATFDGYEVHGVRTYHDGINICFELAPDDEAEFWGLFGHSPGQGLDCIADFATRAHAEEVYFRITGRVYSARRNL